MFQFPNHCNNAPKKKFLIDLFHAFYSKNMEWLTLNLKMLRNTDREKMFEDVKNNKFWNAKTMEIESVITHGKEACVYGRLKLKTGEDSEFCVVFVFTSAGSRVIDTIHSYQGF